MGSHAGSCIWPFLRRPVEVFRRCQLHRTLNAPASMQQQPGAARQLFGKWYQHAPTTTSANAASRGVGPCTIHSPCSRPTMPSGTRNIRPQQQQQQYSNRGSLLPWQPHHHHLQGTDHSQHWRRLSNLWQQQPQPQQLGSRGVHAAAFWRRHQRHQQHPSAMLQQLATASRTAARHMGSLAWHPAAAATAEGCLASWSYHVHRVALTVGCRLLAALHTAGPHLPMALGLLLADRLSTNTLLNGVLAEAARAPRPPVQAVDPAEPSSSTQAAASSSSRSWFDSWMDSVSAGARLIWLLCLFLPLIVATPFALELGWIPRAWWMNLLRGTLEAAGPAFIKWGQWAATRHDLFPPDMCSALEALHASAPAHSAHYTITIIQRSFGLPTWQLFEWLEPEPMASGSIGQIHRARLSRQGALLTGCPEGALVAVKVRHPGVGAMIERDFKTMVWMAHLVGELMPAAKQLRLEDTLKQFAAPLHEQVDLAREARNLYRFNHNFRHARTVNFPTPYYPLVSPDVLVESFEPGRHISKFIMPGYRHPYSHRLAELGSGTMLQMMLVDNLIHADLHPGNILVQLEVPSGLLGLAYNALASIAGSVSLPLAPAVRQHLRRVQASWLQPRLVLLDVGMATELSPEDQTNMLGLFKCFAALDGRGAGNWILRFSGQDQTCEEPEAFLSELESTFDELRKTQVQGWDNAHFDSGADALACVLESVRMHGVSLPGHICAVVVTTLILEGWSNQLDPSHSVLTQVQGMFEPQNFKWHERMSHVVDKVMDRDDTAFAMA